MEVQLEDFLSVYPDQNDPEFQKKISETVEFSSLSSIIGEPFPVKGNFFKHQLFIQLLMLIVDEVLLIHRMGTGKTCTFAAFAELAKHILRSRTDDKLLDSSNPKEKEFDPHKFYPYNRALVVVKGETMIQEFKYQLSCKCTDREYETASVKSATSESTLKRNITNAINKFYDVTTYGTLANKLEKMTDEEIRNEYSGKIIAVDEVHNLRSEGLDDPTSSTETKKIYVQIHRLIHKTIRRKVMLLTATPMVNNVDELAGIMNLILPEDNQMPTRGIAEMTLEQLHPYLNGRVSYVREINKGVVKVPKGTNLIFQGRKYNKIVNKSEMEGIQRKVYEDIESTDRGKLENNVRHCSNFTFPDGSYDDSSFNKFVEGSNENYRFRSYDIALYFQTHLRELSSKFYEIIRLARANPKKKRYVFFEYKNVGAILFGLCLELFGYQRYTRTESAFQITSSEGLGGLKTYCSHPDDIGERVILENKAPRYALLTSETSPTRLSSIMSLINSEENIDGEYIQILIGSPISKEGINLSDFRCFDNVNPWWNESYTTQAEGRIIRATGFIYTTERERRRSIKNHENPDDIRIEVESYSHCATIPGRDDTIDEHMYKISEEKNIEISKVMRYMKQCSVDCFTHYKRNVRPTDIDGSVECDYQKCEYKCINEPPKEAMEAYNLIVSQRLVEETVPKIIDLFSNVFVLTIDEIQKMTSISKLYCLLCLQNIIDHNIPIINRYGIESFLRNYGNYYYLIKDKYIVESNADDLFYAQTLLIKPNINYESIIYELHSSEQSEIINKIYALSADDPNFEQAFNYYVDKLNKKYKIVLFEEAVKSFVTSGERTLVADLIIKKWSKNLYYLLEPTRSIVETAKLLSVTRSRRGKRSAGDFRRAEAIEQASSTSEYGDPVYIHILNDEFGRGEISYQAHKSSKYENQTCKLRIFIPSKENKWRNVALYELPVYAAYIADKIKKEEMQYAQYLVYGRYSVSTGKFWVVDNRDQNILLQTDNRKKRKGLRCKSFGVEDLAEICILLKAFSPYWDSGIYNNIQDAKQKLMNLGKPIMCDAIFETMKKLNIILNEE